MARFTKEQQETLRHMMMWNRDWGTALQLENPTAADIEQRDWFAHMALSDAERLGLDIKIVFGEALLKCAEDYRATI